MRLRNDRSVATRLFGALFLLTLVNFSDSQAIAATLKVPGSFATIQEAIDAASAGDTIKISKGRYIENIVVNKSLTIRGKKYKTRIQAADGGSPVVTIAADDVELKQFDTRGGSFGVVADGVSNVKLQSLRVRNAQADGIFLRNVDSALLNKCRAYENGGIGIFLESNDASAGNVIQKCRVYKNSGYGISLEQSPGTLVEACRVYDNNLIGISGGTASHGLRIRRNRVWGHAWYGISLEYATSNHLVESNVCSKNGDGIHLGGSHGVANRNVCEKNEIGFSLGESLWVLERNKARKNTSHGFEILGSPEGGLDRLTDNESSDNGGSGFRIFSSDRSSQYKDNLAKGNAEHGFHITPFGGLRGAVFDGNSSLQNDGDGFLLTEIEGFHSIPATTAFNDNFADNNAGFGFVNAGVNDATFDGNSCGGNNEAGPSDPVALCD